MSTSKVTIVAPCYNENIIVISFLKTLEATLSGLPYVFRVVIVNDCSTDNTLQLLRDFRFKAPNMQLSVVNLRFNMGHQGAIYQGFLYARTLESDCFIVMDSDGEDAPQAIPELLQHKNADIVNVVRSKRKESLMFKIFYTLYKALFRMVTGKQMNFGNFCLISRQVLECAIFSNFSHFAAFLSKQRIATESIVANREQRIGGQSKMSFQKLFYHAFNSFVEYGEDMLMVFLKSFLVISVVLLITVGNVIYQKFFAHTAILGWTSTVIIGLVNIIVLCIGFFVMGLLLLNINNKNPNKRIPSYDIYTDDTEEIL